MEWWKLGGSLSWKVFCKHNIHALLTFLIILTSVIHMNLTCMKSQDLKCQLSVNCL